MLVWEVMTKFTFPQSFGKSIVSLEVSDPFQWEDMVMSTNWSSLNSLQLTREETLLLSLPGLLQAISNSFPVRYVKPLV